MKFLTLALIFICQASSAKTTDGKVYKLTNNKLNLVVELSSLNSISRKEAGKFKLEFFDSSKKKRSPIKLIQAPEAHLWMVMKGGHGHGSEDLSLKVDNNTYLLSNAWFLMMGEWQLKLKFKHNGAVVQSILPICVERKPADSHLGHCVK